MKLNHLIIAGALLAPGVYAETAFNDTPTGESASPPAQLTAHPLGDNTERQLPPDAVFNLWVQDETFFKPHEDDRIEVEKVLDKKYETFKLKDAVPPIGFAYGVDTVWDTSLGDKESVWFEAGDHESLVHLSGRQFHELMAPAERGQFSHHV